MKKHINTLLILFFILITIAVSYAQECNTPTPDKDILDRFKYRAKKMSNKDEGEIKHMKLVITVVAADQEDTDQMTDELIRYNVAEMNRVFAGFYKDDVPFPFRNDVADVGMVFTLEKIIRVQGTKQSYQFNTTFMEFPVYMPNKFINIYYVGNYAHGGQSLFPSPERVGSYYDGSIVNITNRNSKTDIHELGHWLGLYHTFQDGCVTGDCATTGDRCCDVPPATQGNNCIDLMTSCGHQAFKHNPMDYVSGSCRIALSNDQKTRMRNNVNGLLSYLVDGSNENELPTRCTITQPNGDQVKQVNETYIFAVDTDSEFAEVISVVTSENNKTSSSPLPSNFKYNTHNRVLEVDFTAKCYNGSVFIQSQKVHVSVIETPNEIPITEIYLLPDGSLKFISEDGQIKIVE